MKASLPIIALCVACFSFGVSMAFWLVSPIHAYDPCDNYQQKERKQEWTNNPRPDEDAAMQFYWQDGKPSLQPR